MFFRRLTYHQALNKHPGCIIELKYRRVDAAHFEHERVPTATAPAIFVWPNRGAADTADEKHCTAVYWLVDDE